MKELVALRFRIHPYRQGSRSALALAEALGGRVLKLEGSKFIQRPDDVVINWGDSRCDRQSIINKAEAVQRAADKREAFKALKASGVTTPLFATSRDGVTWEGLTVVRHKLSGHSGEGIELRDASDLPDAPLYVQYVPKKTEYRVHVVGERVVLVQRKARDSRCDNPNWKVRNHQNGFIFVRNDVQAPWGLEEQAVRAVKTLGLDFGAVDLIYNENRDTVYVLEVNCAPGLEGSTIDDYANGFKSLRENRSVG
jgi:glutathione synthase/RimK-type ligase-like ATP-grasp enzyme